MDTLTVVNKMLGTMGEVPLNSLSDSHRLLGAALEMLDSGSREVQAKSWWFNTDTITLEPSSIDGSIYLPTDTRSIRVCARGLVQRGNRLYNTDTSSYIFESSETLEIVRQIPFDLLPEAASSYIGAQAIYEFQTLYDSDSTKSRQLAEKMMNAKMELNSEETRQRKVNLITGNSRLMRLKFLTRNARRLIR